MKKSICICIAALLGCAVLLSSCGSGTSVMTYNGTSITENEFQFYLATYKAKFAETYSDFKDNEAFYRQSIGDTTAEDYLFSTVVDNVSYTLLCDALFKQYGLALSSSVTAGIDEYVDSFLYDYADGNRNVLNQALGNYGINMKLFREILLRDERSYAVYDYLYGSDGVIGINDDDRQAYLEANYARVRHIYVNNAYVYATDENGNVIYDEYGQMERAALDEETQAAKDALVAAIDEALAAGEDFDTVYAAASEDQYYPEGYYLTRTMDFIDGVVRSAFDMEIGEWTKVESDVGVHYIMRLPLGDKPWADESCADFFPDYDETVSAAVFTAVLDGLKEQIEYNDEVLSRYTVQDSPMNTRFS